MMLDCALSCAGVDFQAMKAFLLRMFGPNETTESINMAETVISSVIKKLLKYREDDRLTNEDMKRIIKEMREISNIVRDKKLRDWRRLNFLVSDLVHMADDALDLYKHRRSNNFPHGMDSIHSWIGEIKLRMLELGDDTESSNMRSSQNDDGDVMVGSEEDMEMLLRTRIIRGPIGLSTLLIKGVSGTEKTTLARQLYNHAAVIKEFECRAWVCVSTDLTLKELLLKLLQELVVEVDHENLSRSSLFEEKDNRSLLYMICLFLQDMKYLIVLDDLPRQIHLRSILESLPQASNGSRLLLTSDAMHTIVGMDYVHQMKPLDSNKSLQLFYKTIIPKASRNAAEAAISVIQKLEKYREDQTNEDMEKVIKQMREILHIVRDKGLGEGRRLNFMVCDLVHIADYSLDLYKTDYVPFEMEHIHSWMTEIQMRMLKLGVDDGAETTTELSNRRSSENDEDVVGLEEDVDMVIRIALFEEVGPWSFLIKGISGTGKTTLAREIYNHAAVIKRFKYRAWVCVSTELTIKELLIELIQQIAVVDGEKLHGSSLLEEMDNRGLLSILCEHLEGKLYLIVLDDLPKQMHIESTLKALPGQYNRCKVLVTSHAVNWELIANVRDIHQMKPLDSSKSWQLFFKTINSGNKLTSEQKFPMSLKHKGKQMLRKCAGLPLAIKEVAKQLAQKKASGESEWEQLLESVDMGSTLKLLDLFYQKLDPKLESCFLYLAFYKENSTLRAEKLTQIWVAGGALSRYSQKSYLDDLVNESIIDVKDKSTEYRMNALLHMLFIQKAEEKIGFEILRCNGNNQPFQSPRHHRVIICSRDRFNHSTDQDKHLVSLFFHGGGYFDISPSYWMNFVELKILDLEDFGLKILPETIGTLVKLRYLGLRNNYIQELPYSLVNLEKLEVLDIAQNFMVEVPDIIWEMCSLRRLYLSDVICRKPLKVDALQFLKTLTYVSVDNWTYELSGLQMMTHLEKLGIEELHEKSYVRTLFVSLADLKNLDHLILRGYRFRSMPCLDKLDILQGLRKLKLYGRLAGLPNNLPVNIVYLTFVDSCLDEDPMPLLEKLTRLEHLTLRNAYTGQQMVISKEGFRWLTVLRIQELWNLRNVQLGKKGLNWLKKLEIHDCPKLDTLPKEIVSILFLTELKMVTTKKIATKIRNSELFSKIPIVNISP